MKYVIVTGTFLFALILDADSASQHYSQEPFELGPVAATLDLRNMVRAHIVRRSCELLGAGAERRLQAFESGNWLDWRDEIRRKVLSGLGDMPFGADGLPLNIRFVSRHEFSGYDLENVLFESLPGWDVNASIYLPKKEKIPPPWPAIVVPVGHSGKQMKNYQIPAQVFAKLGYVAVTFDPPGMAGEKQGGNDHFSDGVRCYLTGHSSNRYFVIDALRCIDYLETRPDVDMRNGVGMTGVSGGGTTAMFATLLDERIRASGPSCCALPNAFHPVLDVYAPCVETLAAGRFADGLDDVDLLCAALPTPVFLMCGISDEVFKIQWSREIAADVRNAYERAGQSERFDFYDDPGGHAYTVEMAVRFAKWMDRWVRGEADRILPNISEAEFEMISPDLLRCHPRLDGNIFTMNRALAEKLHDSRVDVPIREAAMQLARVKDYTSAPKAREGKPSQLWFHSLQEILLQPEPDIELPATFLYPIEENWKGGALLYFDDRGRWTDLCRQGLVADIAGFIQRESGRFAIFTVDLRGWGDSQPAYLPYEIAGWGDRSRWIAYVSAAMGDPILAMRIRDGLSALAYLCSRAEVDPDRIVIGGHGMGGVVALHVAAIDGNVAGVFSIEGLASFESLALSGDYEWSHEDFFPDILRYYDLPDLAAFLKMPTLLVNPLGPAKQPVALEEAERLCKEALERGDLFQMKLGGDMRDVVKDFTRRLMGGNQ
ncbi:MAG: alpha/beta fold hydrolase [bacterium]